eukprot:SAG22_NODE_11177_length_497_cov_0.683417_1_plen_111_part_10
MSPHNTDSGGGGGGGGGDGGGGSGSGGPRRAVAHAPGCLDIDCNSTLGFLRAMAVASKAQTIVVLLGLGANHIGGHPPTPGPGGESFEGEGHDRSAIGLPGKQGGLVASLR